MRRGLAVVASGISLVVTTGCGRVAFETRPAEHAGVDGADTGGDVGVAPIVGTYEAAVDATSIDVTIAAVEPARTLLLCDYRTDSSSVRYEPMCELVDGTTVRIIAGQANANCIVRLQVVQLPAGSSVRRGIFVVGSGESIAMVPVGANDPARAFPLISQAQNVDLQSFDERFEMTAQLTATELVLQRNSSGNTVTVAWQVVEIPGSTVDTGVIPFPAGTSGTGASVGVAPSRSFVVGSARVTGGVEEDTMFRFELRATGSVYIQRNGGAVDATAAYHAVEVPSIVAEHGLAISLAEAMTTIPLARRVDPSRSMAIATALGGSVGGVDERDELLFTAAVTGDGDSLLLQRNAMPISVSNAQVAWSVIEWQ